ncbi:MAG TPA: efflux RND transporter periplasmic adaptor subunit [Cryomorphaceae bacterium]|nr:efflux RND transporter periplasmic adaptor subunit [Cryomorphaceae bacterium]
MMKKLTATFFGFLLLISCEEEQITDTSPPTVQVVSVIQDTVQIEKDFVGQVYGITDIPIRARVEGFLEGVHFQEGMKVKKGQLLYSIDPQPFKASLTAAQSQLAEAEVGRIRASNDLNRVQPLADMKAVSERDRDASIAEKDASEEMVNAAQANVEIQEIQLSYTQIKAPISGLIGKTQAKVGEFVGRSPNPVILNTVSRIDSVRVEFFLTENDYLQLAKEVRADIASGHKRETFALKLILSDGSIFEHEGKVDFVNREVDATTGAILIQASFPNPEGLIRPGQFARVRAIMEQMDKGVLVPQRAVSEFQGRFSVMAVTDSNTVKQKPIEILGSYRDYYIITRGVTPGESIIFEGLQKAKEGQKVTPDPIEFKSQYVEMESAN